MRSTCWDKVQPLLHPVRFQENQTTLNLIPLTTVGGTSTDEFDFVRNAPGIRNMRTRHDGIGPGEGLFLGGTAMSRLLCSGYGQTATQGEGCDSLVRKEIGTH